jgi:uncharacterized Tic20 family protein
MPDDLPSEIPGPASLPIQIPSTSDDRTMGLLAHIGGIPTGFIIPLVIWLIKKDQSRFVDDQGKEALNFQLNLLVHAAILTVIGLATCGFGFLLFIPWGVYAIVMPIIAGVKAYGGDTYRYPATVRVIN